ncbi:MAG: hypothetical protein WDZ28_01425 [Simkaniaceae bacterium]
MRRFRVFFIFFLFSSADCFSSHASELLEAIDQEDTLAIIEFFDQVGDMSIEEAYELICDFYEHFLVQFGSDILTSKEYLMSLDSCKEIYHSILDRKGISIHNSQISDTNNSLIPVFLCRANIENVEAEIPGSMVVGGVEILGGALVWILPFPGTKQLASFMIGDGIRRTFDGLEKMDEENKQN